MTTRLLTAAFVAALTMGAPALAATKPAPKPVASTTAFQVDKARLDAALADMVASGRVAGAMAVVWKDGAERYFGTSGFADREAARPMTRDTLVQIWSMTKPVTGVALMQLWEQGRFQLDDPVAKYLPEFASMQVYAGKDASGAPSWRPASRPILIRDLMRHTAGLSYGPGGPVDAEWKRADPLNIQNDLPEMGRRLATVPLLFEPGKQWSYSAAVDVQALLVQTISGQPFEAYVREHVLTPLGMKDTAWTQPPENLPRLAATYVRGSDGKIARQPDAQTRAMNFGPRRLTMGGAGLVASIDDYLRFARMLLNGGELDGVRLLKPSTIRLMATDQLDPSVTDRIWLPSKGSVGFGMDFAVRKSQPQTPEENRGAVGEFFWDGAASTLFWVDPANKLTAVLFVQRTPFDASLHHDFRQAVYGPAYLGPKGD